MLRFLETWKDTLPPSALAFILEKVVMPELVAGADSWSPTWWTEPASVWVSPWIPHLGVDRLHGAGELGRWMKGRDVTRCAYGKVSQWKGVFDPETWDESLRDLTISPTRTWGGSNTFPLVMRWALLVPARYMVPVLESEFFGKWRYAVYRFVTEVRPIPGKAAVWYQSWKDLFTPELLADERVLLQLETGLGMINRAAQGQQISWPEHSDV
uniref:GCF C-terminal domain-containing protein n=1 Tax=Oryza meridionalis TaxID=40149 RepID=A0A0E0DG43_9ORYZ